jgi:hypothetical protein
MIVLGLLGFALNLATGGNITTYAQEAISSSVPKVEAPPTAGEVKPETGEEVQVKVTGVVDDWSTHHLIFSNPGTEEEAVRNGTHARWLSIVNNPRYIMQQMKRRSSAKAGTAGVTSDAEASRPPDSIGKAPSATKTTGSNIKRDWTLSLGSNGTVAPNMYPAKFSFNAGSTITSANCTSDFVIYGLDVAGTATQANLVALDNLYSGASGDLCGAGPSVLWAYNVSTLTNGAVTTSPVLSLDGTRVAFVESNGTESVLHVLKWAAGGSVSSPATLTTTTASSANSCTAPCMVSLAYGSTGTNYGTTLSSPFYYYATDTLYVGNDNGQLFEITGALYGTPTVVSTGGWPASVAATTKKLTSPVMDFNSGNLFVGAADGNLYAVLASNPATRSSLAVGSGVADGGGIVVGPTIDGANAVVIAYAAANAAGVGAATASTTAVAVQAITTKSPFSSQTLQVATIGEGSLGTTAALNVVNGSFDDLYYSWDGLSDPNTGNYYVIGTAAANASPTLYQLQFSGVASIAEGTEGTGYSAPVVTITDTGGIGYGATATTTGGLYAVTGSGGAFSVVPTGMIVTSLNGAGSGAALTAHYGLTALSVNAPGSGYTSVPTVTITGGTQVTALNAPLFLGVVSYTLNGTGTYLTSNNNTAGVPTVTVAAATGTGNPTTTSATLSDTVSLASSAGIAVGTAGSRGCLAGTYNITGSIGTTDTVTITVSGSDVTSVSSYTHTGTYTPASEPKAPTTICGNAISISSISVAAHSSSYVATTATAHGFVTGDKVTITGVTCTGSCSGNNLTFNVTSATISAASGTSFTYTSTTSSSGSTHTSNANTGSASDNTAGTQPLFTWHLSVTAITPTNTSSGYTSPPTVTITPASGSSLSGSFSATANLGVTSVKFNSGGDYTGAPAATVSGSGGATLTQTWQVNSVAVTTPGTGYSEAPLLGFNGGTGSDPSLTDTITISGYVVTYGGGGYTSPAVSVSDSTGTNAVPGAITLNAGNVMSAGSPTTNSAIGEIVAAVQASPITEIYNSNSSGGPYDLLFYGYGLASEANSSFLANQNITGGGPITSGTAAAYPLPEATGGSSGIVVDNIAPASQQGSNIYFATLAQEETTENNPVTITGLTVPGIFSGNTTYTATVGSTAGLAVGNKVTIANVQCSGGGVPNGTTTCKTSFIVSSYLDPNGTQTVTGVTSTTFTFTSTGNDNLGTYTFDVAGPPVATATWSTYVPSGYAAVKLTQTGLQ